MAGVLPGPLRQNGYVVTDLDASIDHWVRALGVGPWYTISDITLEPCQYRGETVSTHLSIALANSGELQIELIRPHDDAPSCYREFLDGGGEGLHHLAWWTEDFEGTMERATDAGWGVLQSGSAMGPRFCYFDTGAPRGAVAELMELNEMSVWLAETVREASRDWDGVTDPVRSLF